MKRKKLYRCQACGHVDHDEQDGTGHWEQGTSQSHYDVYGWSSWTLACSKCGAIGDMPEVKVQKEIKFKARKAVRKKNPETAKVDRKIDPERRQYHEGRFCVIGLLEGRQIPADDTHELRGGCRKQNTKLNSKWWLPVSRLNHQTLQGMTKPKQIALKVLFFPDEFSADVLTEYTPFIDAAEVLKEIAALRKSQ